MSDITDDFAAFFESVWGVAPFAWQLALAEQVVTTGRWPNVIDLPTGAGKTSTLDVAIYALARRPDAQPRRVAFVVDRRTIVDQTTQRARSLADALQRALGGTDTPLARVARSLAALSDSRAPLDVGHLRGGLTGNDSLAADWLRWPDQPAVIVSTIDQFGSRPLFRGYGVSAGMRPVHAGLTGVDTLILLDEVHLSTAMVETLHALRKAGTGGALARANQVVQMSATPVGTRGETFPGDAALINADPVLAQRATARKDCRLVVPIGKPRQPAELAWPGAIRGLIDDLSLTHGVVGVVVNRVATAVAVHAELVRLGYASVLVTGRMRARERTRADEKAATWADPGRVPGESLRVVVATQCIEVGADYSFDGLITEICPLSALRQRLGRLDRRGAHAASGRPANALVVACATQADDDAIYGLALGSTWSALEGRFGPSPFDGGPMSADLANLRKESVAPLDPPPTRAAVLMPAHLDLLAATNPEPPASPDIDPFLHGFREPNADVTLVWRFDLGGAGESGLCPREVAQSILGALPAQPAERIDVPLAAVRRWLTGRQPMPVSDVDAPGEQTETGTVDRTAWTLDDDGNAVIVGARTRPWADVDPADLRPGAVLYLPCAWGGLREGTWDPTCIEVVTDIGDEAARAMGWVAFRPADDDAAWRHPDTNPESDGSPTRDFVRRANALAGGPAAARATPADIVRYGERWAVIHAASRALDGRDATNSHTGVQVALSDHLNGVSLRAADMARRCGLPEEVVSDFALAGVLHDLGKADPRFQLSLVDDEIALAMASQLLAKSTNPGRGHRPSADPRWTYPPGTRHEYLSVTLAGSHTATLATAHDRDLVLHLVATHHGKGRPWPSVVDDPYPRLVSVPSADAGLAASTDLEAGFGATNAERFRRLARRHGPHGLAWLEAIFRLADHRQSEAEAAAQASGATPEEGRA